VRILVAEDESVSRKLLEKSLLALGHEVVLAGDGREAWEAFAKGPTPVVITDWMMPGMDGLELTRRIRASGTRAYPWIILLTAREFRHNYRESMEAGIDDYLTKPLDRDLLATRLRVAERVHRMSQQVRALSSALPICMHCKSIRDSGENWRRLEDYFKATSDIDFSHGLCPDCLYDEWLAPALGKLRGGERPPPPSPDVVLDEARLARFVASVEAKSPELFGDLVESLVQSAAAVRDDLRRLASTGHLGESARRRVRRYADRCEDLAAGRAAASLRRLERLPEPAPSRDVASLAQAAETEFDAAIEALRARSPAGAAAAAAAKRA